MSIFYDHKTQWFYHIMCHHKAAIIEQSFEGAADIATRRQWPEWTRHHTPRTWCSLNLMTIMWGCVPSKYTSLTISFHFIPSNLHGVPVLSVPRILDSVWLRCPRPQRKNTSARNNSKSPELL